MGRPGKDAPILVLNAGSSSIKFAMFDGSLKETLSGIAAGIGGQSFLQVGKDSKDLPLIDHKAALSAILKTLADKSLTPNKLRAAAHRVVHGGRKLNQPMRLSADVRAEIESCTPLAPLHNPHNLAAIDTLAEVVPDLPQFASFDTSFHATNPDVATRYAIPRMMETKGIRRYGFHGLSYASLVQRLPEISGDKLPSRL